jgi:hypothetical protein
VSQNEVVADLFAGAGKIPIDELNQWMPPEHGTADSLEKRNQWVSSERMCSFMNQHLQQFLPGKRLQVAGGNQYPRLPNANHRRSRDLASCGNAQVSSRVKSALGLGDDT